MSARPHASLSALSPQNPTPSRVQCGATPPENPAAPGDFICYPAWTTAAKNQGKAGEIPPPSNSPKPLRRPACAARKRPRTVSTMKQAQRRRQIDMCYYSSSSSLTDADHTAQSTTRLEIHSLPRCCRCSSAKRNLFNSWA